MKIEITPPKEFDNYRFLSTEALRLALAALRRKHVIINYNQIIHPVEMPIDDRADAYVLSKPTFPSEFNNVPVFPKNQHTRALVTPGQTFAY